jgi:DNA polymerase III subunit gamma/tau
MTELFGESASPALALARKWRPRVFADLKGQEHVVQALSNALTQGRLHHAYLLTGTRGVGKTTLARILAKCLNCETGVTNTPCGTCSACTQIDAGRFVDLLELDAASNTGVDNMREVLDNAQYAPTVGRYKVYIIDEVHMLSKPAFNSMLKTLEEPPAHVKFILATTDPQKIPVTVLSRCLQFNLKPMTPTLVAQHLGEVLEKENITFEPAALKLLARAAAGSMRDALSLTDQAIAYGGGLVETAAVDAMLGTVRRDYLYDLLDALAAQDGKAVLDQVRQLAERGISLDAALQDMGHVLTQLALLQQAPTAVETAGADFPRMQSLAGQLDAETLQLYYQIALNGRRDLPYAPDELSGFSMTLLRMLAFTPGPAPASRSSGRAPAAAERPAAARTAGSERPAVGGEPRHRGRTGCRAGCAGGASKPYPWSPASRLRPDPGTGCRSSPRCGSAAWRKCSPTIASWFRISAIRWCCGWVRRTSTCSTAPTRTSSSVRCASVTAPICKSDSRSVPPPSRPRSRCAPGFARRARPRRWRRSSPTPLYENWWKISTRR